MSRKEIQSQHKANKATSGQLDGKLYQYGEAQTAIRAQPKTGEESTGADACSFQPGEGHVNIVTGAS